MVEKRQKLDGFYPNLIKDYEKMEKVISLQYLIIYYRNITAGVKLTLTCLNDVLIKRFAV